MKVIARNDWARGVIFWKPRAAGYTDDLDAAGRYDDEALKRLRLRQDGDDIVMDEADALAISHREVSRDAFESWRRAKQ